MKKMQLSIIIATGLVSAPAFASGDWNPVGPGEYAETKESPEITMARKLREAEALLRSEEIKTLAKAQTKECDKAPGSVNCHAAAELFSARLEENLEGAQRLLSDVVSEGGDSDASKRDLVKRRRELERAITRLQKEKNQARSRQAWDAVRRIAGGRGSKVASEAKILGAVETAIDRYKQLLDGLGGGSLQTMRARARAMLLHVDVTLMRVRAVREINYLSVLEEYLQQTTNGDFALPAAEPVVGRDTFEEDLATNELPDADVVYGAGL